MSDFLVACGRVIVLLFCALMVALLFAIPQCHANAVTDGAAAEENADAEFTEQVPLFTVIDGRMTSELITVPREENVRVAMCMRANTGPAIECLVYTRSGGAAFVKLYLKRREV